MSFITRPIAGLLGGVVTAITSAFSSEDDDNPIRQAIQPATPAAPAPKAPTEADVDQAAEAQRKKVAMMQGRTSTLATAGGWKGLGESEEDDPMKTVKRKLLG